MDEKIWNNQLWLCMTTYPKGIKSYLWMSLLFTAILCISIFSYRYPIYQTFYGLVKEDGNDIIELMVPMENLEDFQKAVENKEIVLKQMGEYIAEENILFAYAQVPMNHTLLIKNNLVSIKLKIKKVSLWDELTQKWKEGIT